MAKERLLWVDSLKGILMLLVVYGHAIAYVRGDEINELNLWNMMYSFYMPAFMAVSGWLTFRPTAASGGGILSVIFKWARQLLIPYFIWSLIKYVLDGVYSLEGFRLILLKPDSFLWFLWVLFFIRVIFLLAQLFSNKWKINEDYVIVAIGAMLIVMMVVFEFRHFGYQFIAYYFLYFALGYYLHKYLKLCINNQILLIALFIVWAVLAWSWKVHELPGWVPQISYIPSAVLQYAYRGITAFLAIILIFSVVPKCFNSSNWLNERFAYLGVISLGLYVVHMAILQYLGKLLSMIPGSYPKFVEEIILLTIALVVSIVIIRLLQKNKWTAMLLLGQFK